MDARCGYILLQISDLVNYFTPIAVCNRGGGGVVNKVQDSYTLNCSVLSL